MNEFCRCRFLKEPYCTLYCRAKYYLAKIRNYVWCALRLARDYLTVGFDTSDIWNLDYSLATWILPRLRYFRQQIDCYPEGFGSLEAWQAAVDDMIYALDYINDSRVEHTDIEEARYERGITLFAEHLRSLWT